METLEHITAPYVRVINTNLTSICKKPIILNVILCSSADFSNYNVFVVGDYNMCRIDKPAIVVDPVTRVCKWDIDNITAHIQEMIPEHCLLQFFAIVDSKTEGVSTVVSLKD